MAPDIPFDDRSPEEDLEEQERKKDDEVLEREGFEQELMQEGESEIGEEIEGVQEERA
ncbi:MAG: hypothetical protein M3144_02280 [Actinomycetota bacterium]|nr:hypothetical protein [Actinomycetota bacterium]